MSYILDALRRSQAERDRGQVPGLNAQPGAMAGASMRAAHASPWRWLLPGVTGFAAVLALLWWWRPAGVPAAPPAAMLQAPVALPRAMPAPALPVNLMPASAGVSAPPAAPVWVSAPPAAPVRVSAPAAPLATPLTAVAPAQAGPVPLAAPASAPARRALSLAELSAEQRRDLPAMDMGGSIWSENALSRFVIVNGQVVREGDTAAPGVTVERIGPKSVLLQWRGLRLEIAI